MKITETKVIKSFCKMANDGWLQGWHERNGGNLSYRMTDEDLNEVKSFLADSNESTPIGTSVPGLAGDYFVVTGSGKFFGNVLENPEENICIIRIDDSGDSYQKLWGLVSGGRPTSELPTHLMNHEVKKAATNGAHRVIYHAHPANIIALTFVLPLESKVFSRELWETMTECPIIFPAGVGVVRWMVPGGREIAVESAKLMETYDAVIWAHHGLFCSGDTMDNTFGLLHTIEKASEILVKIKSMAPKRLQSITPQEFRDLALAFGVSLPEEYLD